MLILMWILSKNKTIPSPVLLATCLEKEIEVLRYIHGQNEERETERKRGEDSGKDQNNDTFSTFIPKAYI